MIAISWAWVATLTWGMSVLVQKNGGDLFSAFQGAFVASLIGTLLVLASRGPRS